MPSAGRCSGAPGSQPVGIGRLDGWVDVMKEMNWALPRESMIRPGCDPGPAAAWSSQPDEDSRGNPEDAGGAAVMDPDHPSGQALLADGEVRLLG